MSIQHLAATRERELDVVRRTLGVAAILLAFVLSGCSSFRPWQNQPAASGANAVKTLAATPPTERSIVAVVTLTGGGARAAAFGLGVLQEL